MRQARFAPILVVLLLCACGAQPAAQAPAATPTISSTTQALLDSPALNDGHVPEPSPTSAPTEAPTEAPTQAPTAAPTEAPTQAPTAAPTAQLVLPPTSAPAQAQAAAAPDSAASASPPVRLVIADIKMDRQLLAVGLDKNRVPIVPKHDVGWYNQSAAPGQGENVVLWGHVLRFKSAPNIPAPFARLKELKVGAKIVLYDAAGTAHTYAVTQQVWATPDQVEYILPQGHERITMVSCIGDKVIAGGDLEMTHRLITIAEPVS